MTRFADMPDEALVTMARESPEGDLRAFEELVRRHQTPVSTNCRYLSRSETDAEDLAQEVFMKAYFGLASFEGRSPFGAWVKRIKVNHCLNFIRKKKGQSFVDVDEDYMESEPALQVNPVADRLLEQMTQRERIREVLDSLPDTLRVPLILRDHDGLAYEEIAEQMKIGLSATKMRIKRAREEFRARYTQLEQAQDGIP